MRPFLCSWNNYVVYELTVHNFSIKCLVNDTRNAVPDALSARTWVYAYNTYAHTRVYTHTYIHLYIYIYVAAWECVKRVRGTRAVSGITTIRKSIIDHHEPHCNVSPCCIHGFFIILPKKKTTLALLLSFAYSNNQLEKSPSKYDCRRPFETDRRHATKTDRKMPSTFIGRATTRRTKYHTWF